MDFRKDALTAASEIILAFEDICRSSRRLVGTVGKMEIFPNALNVVPGKASLGLEVRCLEEECIENVFECLEERIESTRINRGIAIDFNSWISSPGVVFTPEIIETAGLVCDEMNMSSIKMPSGAGHDANH